MIPTALDVLVIGAGLSGLRFVRLYQKEFPGKSIRILEKSKGLGGRLATRRTEQARFDHGAPFLTSRERICLGDEGKESEPLHPLRIQAEEVFACKEGMTGIAKSLARDLPIEKETRVTKLERHGNLWQADTDQGSSFTAKTVILTAPLPQALSLLDESKIHFPSSWKEIHYSMAIVLLFEGEAFPGMAPWEQFQSGPFLSLCNQKWKGISTSPAWALVAGPELSQTVFEKTDEEIRDAILPTLREKFPTYSGIIPEVKKWRYSQCMNPLQDSFGIIPDAPGLCLIGDAFQPGDAASGIERAIESAHALFRVGKSSFLP